MRIKLLNRGKKRETQSAVRGEPKKSQSQRRMRDLEKENKKLQFRILKLKDELTYIKNTVNKQGLTISNNSKDPKTPTKSNKESISKHESKLSQSVDARSRSAKRSERAPRPYKNSQRSVNK